MIYKAGTLPFYAGRWNAFAPPRLRFRGISLTGAVFLSQIRLYPDAPGAALATIVVTLGDVETIDGIVYSTITLTVAEATIEGLPAAAEAGADLELAWDLQITPAGGVKEVYLSGPFHIVAGVTQ